MEKCVWVDKGYCVPRKNYLPWLFEKLSHVPVNDLALRRFPYPMTFVDEIFVSRYIALRIQEEPFVSS